MAGISSSSVYFSGGYSRSPTPRRCGTRPGAVVAAAKRGARDCRPLLGRHRVGRWRAPAHLLRTGRGCAESGRKSAAHRAHQGRACCIRSRASRRERSRTYCSGGGAARRGGAAALLGVRGRRGFAGGRSRGVRAAPPGMGRMPPTRRRADNAPGASADQYSLSTSRAAGVARGPSPRAKSAQTVRTAVPTRLSSGRSAPR